MATTRNWTRTRAWLFVLGCLLGFATAAVAQPGVPAGGDLPRSTLLDVELIAGSEAGGLHAQAWAQVFEKLDVSLVIRRGVGEAKPDLSEKMVGTLRQVKLVGLLARNGDIQFPGRKFERGQSPALKAWFDELRTYGIQGAPTGKPLWGLSKPQFEMLYAALDAPLENEVRGMTLPEAIEQLRLPVTYPLRWSLVAEEQFRALGTENKVRQNLAGFTTATALAILLNDRGFGFRPNRRPDGSIELLVEPVGDDPLERWPVGWPPQQQIPQLLPGLFVMTNVDLYKSPADAVLEGAAKATGTPILVDYAALARAEVDLPTLLLTHPLKKTTWSLALRYMLVPEKLNREFWQDEAGRGFVWVTTIGKQRRTTEP